MNFLVWPIGCAGFVASSIFSRLVTIALKSSPRRIRAVEILGVSWRISASSRIVFTNTVIFCTLSAHLLAILVNALQASHHWLITSRISRKVRDNPIMVMILPSTSITECKRELKKSVEELGGS